MSESICDENSGLADVQLRAADLRIAKAKAEKQFIETMGKELSCEEKVRIEKKRREILYQLEVEGAEIERDFVEKYRSKLAGLAIRQPGLNPSAAQVSCFTTCTYCITTCKDCVTSCAQCISPCPNCVTPCTTAVLG